MMGRWSWLLVAGAAFLAFGCANQGEGERCSRLAGNNGNDDCEPGLSCQSINNLELCCPPPGNPVNDPQCIPSLNIKDGGTGDSASAEDAADENAEGDAEPGSD